MHELFIRKTEHNNLLYILHKRKQHCIVLHLLENTTFWWKLLYKYIELTYISWKYKNILNYVLSIDIETHCLILASANTQTSVLLQIRLHL